MASWFYRQMVKLQKTFEVFKKADIEAIDEEECDEEGLLPFDEKWEFPRNKLQIGRRIGVGFNTMVFEAEAVGLLDGEETTKVAVKRKNRIKNYEEYFTIFCNEIKIMANLEHHPNIVQMLGAVVDRRVLWDYWLILEYCRYGCLLDYMRAHKERFTNLLPSIDNRKLTNEKMMHTYVNIDELDAVLPFDTNILIEWSYQIVKGMEWLASKKILHCDLAARSIFLTDRNLVKIGNFGLAHNLKTDVEYHKKKGTMLPVKWMALESTEDLRFTSQSDVWSFGVLLWEIFTLGRTPYDDFKSFNDAWKALKDGYRLKKPKYSPDQVYWAMKKCWNISPTRRPTFALLSIKIYQLLEQNTQTKINKVKQAEREQNLKALEAFKKGDIGKIIQEKSIYDQADLLPFHDKWEFPRKKLTIEKRLSAGLIGMVFKAEAEGILDGEEVTKVMIKNVRQHAEPEVFKAFEKEIKILANLEHHPHIVNMLGAVVDRLDQRELLLILEHCKYGCLLDYMKEHRGRFISLLPPVDNITIAATEKSMPTCVNIDNEMPFNTKVLMQWSYQIARGMEWLSSKKILHCNLAARSIFLTDRNLVKIGDFGLAHHLFTKTKCLRPLKWMAPESIEDNRFTSQSDVWSYGVLLWEIFSLGKVPYDNFECFNDAWKALKVTDGYRLGKPEHSSEEVYDVMKSCWNKIPYMRPTFAAMATKILILQETPQIMKAEMARSVRKNQSQATEWKCMTLEAFKKGDIGKMIQEKSIYDQADLLPFHDKWEFPRNKLTMGKRLGEGNFGMVFEAEAEGLLDGEKVTKVAVKRVQKDPEVFKAFEKEIKIMSNIEPHPYIVNMLGAVVDRLDQRELLLILEHCKYGCLLDYMKEHRRRFTNLLPSEANITLPAREKMDDEIYMSTDSYNAVMDEMPFDTNVLIEWSYQIARGMEWLASKKILHCDLAARNILLEDRNLVKIGDFGLAHNLYTKAEYRKKKGSKIPIKWMALESIEDLRFTSQSDVWSYGVLLWEIFTLGKVPYAYFECLNDIQKALKMDGYRLEKPKYCSGELYDVMKTCWNQRPSMRPTFSAISEIMLSHLEETTQAQMIKVEEDYKGPTLRNTESGYMPMTWKPETAKSSARISFQSTEPQTHSEYVYLETEHHELTADAEHNYLELCP